MPRIPRLHNYPVRMPVTERFKDMGTIVQGKLQSGYIKKNQKLILMPNKNKVIVDGITVDEEEKEVCRSGDNVKLKLKGVEEEEVSPGHVLCQLKKPCSVCTVFDAQVVILEWKSIIAPGRCGCAPLCVWYCVVVCCAVVVCLWLCPGVDAHALIGACVGCRIQGHSSHPLGCG